MPIIIRVGSFARLNSLKDKVNFLVLLSIIKSMCEHKVNKMLRRM